MLEKRLHDLNREVESLKRDLERSSARTQKNVQRRVRPTLSELNRELESLKRQAATRSNRARRDFEKQAQPLLQNLTHELEAIRDRVEKRSGEIAHDVEKQAQPALHDLAKEVETLKTRVDEGQKQLRHELAQRIEPERAKDVVHQQVNPAADTGVFLFGAIAGALLGALIGLWFAPQSGEKTRHEIEERGLEIRAQAEQTANEARHKIEGPKPDDLIANAKASARLYRDELNR